MTSTTRDAAASALDSGAGSRRGFVRARVAVVGGTLASFEAARAYAPYVHDGPVLCVLRGLTGLPCPGCGLTRALCALSHGDWLGALAFNAAAVPLALCLLAASVIAAGELARGRAWRFYRRWLYSWQAARVVAIAVAVYHVGRCLYWAATGTLASEYLQSSWTARLLQ